jgi:integrative and conjugative element protein (TIGR02256 family)
MTEKYYDLDNIAAIHDKSALTISRAKHLFNAIEQHSDYSLIQLLRFPVDGEVTIEYIIVDIECDGVPPKNSAGILYRERLALCISSDPGRIIDVLALRKNFPILMHQNQAKIGFPVSLCLYFEPAISVMRTWTPPTFLRRIQWWLEKSAQGELHPADQPVEHLFFASKYELVLPWNLEKLREEKCKLVITSSSERPDGGFTFFLQAIVNANMNNGSTTYIELNLHPIIHGTVEHDPSTLGELADILSNRQVDLIAELKLALCELVSPNGDSQSKNDKTTIILLRIPICRALDSEPEGTIYSAFLIPIGALEFGVSVGVLYKQDNEYGPDVFGDPHANLAWREIQIGPMEVLKQNDSAAARRQSGVAEKGPTGVLVGAGSLGSTILNLWGRSGWGNWTVLDKDHIRPHNLSRHTAYAHHIGESKATIVAGLHAAALEGATTITPLVCDATNFKDEPVLNALKAADVVVDASTTLEYPRAASANDTLPRHISIFVTPNGNGSVLLAENKQRTIRLQTIEAQYYRALIQNDWGHDHLSGQISNFWSGAGCRDISVVMPYSRIMGHSCTLAEQIQAITMQEDAIIRIWQREPANGSVAVYNIPTMPERCIPFDDLDLFIDAGAEKDLRDMRKKGLPNETGGVLLGYYDFNIKAVLIVAALSAPIGSKSTPVSFERGIDGLAEAVKEASKRTAGVVGYIGEWHSHPPGCSTSPSDDDLRQLSYLTEKMAEDGLPAFSLIVGERDIQIYKGAEL